MTDTSHQMPVYWQADLQRLLEARHHDPFDVLGKHRDGEYDRIRTFIPGAAWVRITDGDRAMHRIQGSDLFEWQGPSGQVPDRYQLTWQDSQGAQITAYDPYCFLPQLADFDLHLFNEGRHWHAYRFLGAHLHETDGVLGVLFAVWAPNAERVSITGDFNHWDGRRHPMRARGNSGVWELFIPGVDALQLYKFEIRNRQYGTVHLKTDPYGQQYELRPGTASIISPESSFEWADNEWMQRRLKANWLHEPMSIYEVHLGSWKRNEHGGFLDYRTLAHQIVNHVSRLGFTHIELLPITEHPLDASWGYQTTGYFAPTSRFGKPDDFRYFVDHCHRNGIGVLLDWAPGHFPKDIHGLANFDGSALYEHEDPRRGEHRDWGTLIYNYGRNEVKNFLLSSAVYWLEEFHIDGLRVDAVASMLYHDYSRETGDWIPNIYGGRENLEAIRFLRELNEVTHGQHHGSVMIAEESTAWPKVTMPIDADGLGFSMKWNMGWMHDTLKYLQKEPVHRKYHHNDLTFGLLYAFTENFVLPFSHDEVVHGKGSMLNKMPGDDWQRFATLRLLYTYQFTYPGKKLLFMGNEFAQGNEWNFDTSLEWYLLDYEPHRGIQTLISDLNRIYRENPALNVHDFDAEGFEWIECQDSEQSIISYLRRNGPEIVIVALNFTPVPRDGYRLGVPSAGWYQVLFNSDSGYYGGSNLGNGQAIEADSVSWMGRSHSITVTLPPLAGIVIKRVSG